VNSQNRLAEVVPLRRRRCDVDSHQILITNRVTTPTNLGGSTEDWSFWLRRDAVPLATDGIDLQHQVQAQVTHSTGRTLVYGFHAFATALRPEATGSIRGTTPPPF
jgi:hypothetical protein